MSIQELLDVLDKEKISYKKAYGKEYKSDYKGGLVPLDVVEYFVGDWSNPLFLTTETTLKDIKKHLE